MDVDTPPVGEMRRLRAEDSPAVIELIGSIYAEYPGCVLDLPGVDADLPRLRAAIDESGGEFWVVERAGEVVACVGWAPHRIDGRPGAELKRLYVRADERRSGLGRWLVERVEAAAIDAGAEVVELWSDSRFVEAHRLYRRLGYEATGASRELHDPSQTTEYRFVRRLTPH